MSGCAVWLRCRVSPRRALNSAQQRWGGWVNGDGVVCGTIELPLVGQFTYFVLKEANFSGTWGCEVEEVLNEMERLEQTTGWFWKGMCSS